MLIKFLQTGSFNNPGSDESFPIFVVSKLVYLYESTKLVLVVGSSTLPRAQTRALDTEGKSDKVTAATSSTSLYDNVGATQTGSQGNGKTSLQLN